MKKPVAAAIVVAEMVACMTVAGAASAQTDTTSRRRLARQQRLIAQQQREILAYQRQLAAQQRAPQGDTGLLGVLGCPSGYTYSWFGEDCYPNLPAQVIVTSPR